jgi:hypothetical protein
MNERHCASHRVAYVRVALRSRSSAINTCIRILSNGAAPIEGSKNNRHEKTL